MRFLNPLARAYRRGYRDGLAVAVPARDEIERAIGAREAIAIRYRKLGIEEPEWRTISPYETAVSKAGARTVLSFDHDKDGIREFRVDRIDEVVRVAGVEPYRQPQVEGEVG